LTISLNWHSSIFFSYFGCLNVKDDIHPNLVTYALKTLSSGPLSYAFYLFCKELDLEILTLISAMWRVLLKLFLTWVNGLWSFLLLVLSNPKIGWLSCLSIFHPQTWYFGKPQGLRYIYTHGWSHVFLFFHVTWEYNYTSSAGISFLH
jgi:hypothetical protein